MGFVVGKGRSTGPPTLIGFNHTFEFQGTGTIGTTGFYEVHNIYTPGAYYDYRNPQATRTVYDNPLGIMQVLEAPVIEKAVEVTGTYSPTGEFDEREVNKFRYTGGLKYAINEIAGISDVPVRLMGALVWTNCQGDEIVDNFYSTPLINISCLEDYTVELVWETSAELNSEGKLEEKSSGINCFGDPQLQIVAVLESSLPSFNEEILFSARYSSDIITSPGGFSNFPANLFEGLSATEIFTVCDPPAPAPVSGQGLIDFCQRTYDPAVGLGLMAPPSSNPQELVPALEQKDFSMGVSPNPVTDYFSFTFPFAWNIQKVDMELIDLNGKTMLKWRGIEAIPGASFTFADGISTLPSGQYYLRIIHAGGVESFPLIKN